MTKRLLVDAVHPEEVRVVLADESKLIEFEFESAQKKQIKSNIYLGKITRVEPSLQAAFVEYGGNRQGFLPFSEIHYDYFQIPMEDKEKIKRIIEAESPDLDDEEDDIDDQNNGQNQQPISEGQQDSFPTPAQDPQSTISAPNEEKKEFRREERSEDRRDNRRGGKGRRDNRRDRDRGGNRDNTRNADSNINTEAAVEKTIERTIDRAPDRSAEKRDDRGPKNVEGKRARIEIPFPFTQADLRDLLRAEELAKVFALEYASEIIETYPVEAEKIIAPAVIESPAAENNIPIDNTTTPARSIRPDRGNNRRNDRNRSENRNSDNRPAKVQQEDNFRNNSDNENAQNNIIDINDNIEEIQYISPEESFDEEPISLNEDRDPRSTMSRMDFYRQYKIQEVIKRNQVVLIQVVKEERGSKGASLTTYLALAGRYCVFMPNTEKGGGVSRRISSFSERRRIRTIVKGLELPKGSSIIVRTAGMERDETDIKNDYAYLINLWNTITTQTLGSTAPAAIYEESDIVKRSIRDLFKGDVEEVIIQGKEAYQSAATFVQLTSPSQTSAIKLHQGQIPLFQKYKIEERLDELYEREVKLSSGGSIVISPTEALVSIDVNSGRATKERNVEDTAYKTNIEAAREIARQLRLRDLAGLVVIDFIDMRELRNRKNVERELKDALRADRARIQIGRISMFGLLEMSRQRIHSSIVESTSICCPMCNGTGAVRSTESMGLKAIRAIEAESGRKTVAEIVVHVSPSIFREINEKRKADIQTVETNDNVKIKLVEDINLLPNQFEIQSQKGQKRKEKTEKGLSLEEFESLTPPHDAAGQSGKKANGDEVELSQYPEDRNFEKRNNNNRNNRNRRPDNRNRNNDRNNNGAPREDNRDVNNRFGGANDNRNRNNNNNRRNYDNSRQPNHRNQNIENPGNYNDSPSQDRQEYNNVQKLPEPNQQSQEKKPPSNKLMGLWKKITS